MKKKLCYHFPHYHFKNIKDYFSVVKTPLLLLSLTCCPLWTMPVAAAEMPADVPAAQQQAKKKVTGTVTDENGLPLIGANVSEQGTTNGTITDMDGNYSILIDNSANLLVTYIGYTLQEIPVAGKSVIHIRLAEDSKKLEEVVVVGYGTQKRKEITSSVVSVKSENFNKGATTNPMQLVQGKVAGLSITKQNGNDPNSDLSIQLRGVSSAKAGTAPLIIVDGVPGASLHNIAQDDIESIDVLRDGSAAAIYGTRGTNGVIIITTKKGASGSMKFEYNGYASIENVSKTLDVLNASEYRALASQGIGVEDLGADTDWFKELTRNNSFSHYHNLSMTGGSDKFNYRSSVNYRDLQPIVKNTGRQQFGARVNINHRGFNDKLLVQMNLSNTYTDEAYTDYGLFQQALQRPPTIPVMDPKNPLEYYETSGWDYYNPVALQNQYENKGESRFLNADIKATLHVISGLKASLLVSMDRVENSKFNYLPSNANEALKGGWAGRAGREEKTDINKMLEATIEYNLQKVENHTLSVVAGYSYQDFTFHDFKGKNYDFTSDAFQYNNLGNGSYLKDGRAELSTSRKVSKLISFFGRANYAFRNRYLASVSLRQEGSSKFGMNNRWGLFPAISAGWRISEEDFMENVAWINDLKVRVGYGVTGNQSFDPYQSLSKLGDGGKYYDATTGEYVSAFGQGNNPNPDLRWEKKHEWNIGADFSLFNSKLSGTLDVYNRKTQDLLFMYSAQKPPLVHDEILTNVGTMNNSGVELSLTYMPVQTKDFSWETTVTYSYNKNELESLSNAEYSKGYYEYGWLDAPGNPGNAFRMEEGRPVASFYGYEFAGFNADGKWLLRKQDGSTGTRSEMTPEDKKYLGNGAPDMFAGWNNSFRYKNWDLTLFFRGAFGFEVCNMKEMYNGNKNLLPKNVLTSALDKHAQLNDDAVWSDYYLENGSYVKLDNLTLGYTVKKNNKYIQNLRLYLSAQNLLTLTGYSGIDPEIEQAGLEAGVDGRKYFPRTRTFSLGVSMEF